jgi:hypothetical protein
MELEGHFNSRRNNMDDDDEKSLSGLLEDDE